MKALYMDGEVYANAREIVEQLMDGEKQDREKLLIVVYKLRGLYHPKETGHKLIPVEPCGKGKGKGRFHVDKLGVIQPSMTLDEFSDWQKRCGAFDKKDDT